MPNRPQMNSITERLFDITGQTYINLECAKIAYQEYIKSGKLFFHARTLMVYNQRVRTILLEGAYLFPTPLQQDALALIRHIDIWTALWNDWQSQTQPRPEDVFAFENKDVFPRQAASNLEAAYLALKERLA